MKSRRELNPQQEKASKKKVIFIAIILGLIVDVGVYFRTRSPLFSIISFVMTFVVIVGYFYVKRSLDKSARIKKIEGVYPDFLQLMSSNLRAGMTIDKAMLLSSRPEFDPLDAEIFKAGKDITTGKNMEISLLEMSKRIGSEKIHKIMLLIISGIRAGGNLAILLEQTSSSMRERDLLDKKASSNVLMYVIFIFLAVAIFAPFLFSLSTILVEVLTSIFSGLPELDAGGANMPFSLSQINVSITFIKTFAIFFMLTIDFLASLVLGLVSKGEEKQGLRYFPIIAGLSLTVFFVSRIFISRFMSGIF